MFVSYADWHHYLNPSLDEYID